MTTRLADGTIGDSIDLYSQKTQGLFLKLSVQDNASVMYLRKLRSKVGLLNTRKCRSLTEQYIKKLNIKTPSQGQLIENLSGGNQQKVVIARCLMNHPKILFMDEPTQGIDVGAKEEIYQIMNELVKRGRQYRNGIVRDAGDHLALRQSACHV